MIADLACDPAEGAAARVHDPLWCLARQWQMGELAGEDNGSPIGARMEVEAGLLARWRPDVGHSAKTVMDYDGRQRPLEACVEAEVWQANGVPHFRLAAEMGIALRGQCDGAGLVTTGAMLAKTYPLVAPATPDLPSQRYTRLLAGRTIDGIAVLRELAPLRAAGNLAGVFATFLQNDPDDPTAVLTQLDAWLERWRAIDPAGSVHLVDAGAAVGSAAAWQRERLEYAFTASARLADGEVTLAVSEHVDGDTDWYSFVQDPSIALGAPAHSATKTFTFLPGPARFKGMPSARFWELEESSVNLPVLARDRPDPARALLVDFILRYGNDWFTVPLPLPAGSVSLLRSLVVTNTFGERSLLRHVDDGAATPEWTMFSLSSTPSDPSATGDPQAARLRREAFLLPLKLGQVMDSAAHESVSFARDEMANLGWAIETLVESAAAMRFDRAEAFARNQPATRPPANAAAPVYRLGTSVPDYWIPLMPDPASATRLLRGASPRTTPSGVLAIPAMGRILEPDTALSFFEEEIPREGVVVTRCYRYTRSVTGQPVLWIGRRKRQGRGEASSGLRFDVVEN